MLTRRRMIAFAATAAAALALGACGGSDDGGVEDTDPASLAPTDTWLYVQGTIRPKGKLKADIEALGSAISSEADPVARLIELIDEGLAETDTESGKRLSFEKDIDPWLGQQFGIFVESYKPDPPAAGIVQTTDPDAAQQFIDDAKERDDVERSYGGVDYILDEETAAGVVDDFLVIGEEPAFERAVDVSAGGGNIGENEEFTSTLDEAPTGSLVDVYADLGAVTEVVRANDRADDSDNADGLETALGETSGKSVIASLVPAADSLELDIATDADVGTQLADVSALIETLPADSFAAVGVPNLGQIVDRSIDQLEQQRVGGITREAIDQQLSQAGLSLDDITRALGDLGLFATGTSEATLQGAAVIVSDDPEAAQNLISKLTAITGLAQLSGSPNIRPAPVGNGISITDPEELGAQPLIVTTEGDRIAIGYGAQATEQALAKGAGTTLGDDPTYQQAVKALGGDDLSGYVSMPGVLRLAESLGATADPDYRQAKPYLDRLGYAIFGSGEQGDFQNSKIVVGVKD